MQFIENLKNHFEKIRDHQILDYISHIESLKSSIPHYMPMIATRIDDTHLLKELVDFMELLKNEKHIKKDQYANNFEGNDFYADGYKRKKSGINRETANLNDPVNDESWFVKTVFIIIDKMIKKRDIKSLLGRIVELIQNEEFTESFIHFLSEKDSPEVIIKLAEYADKERLIVEILNTETENTTFLKNITLLISETVHQNIETYGKYINHFITDNCYQYRLIGLEIGYHFLLERGSPVCISNDERANIEEYELKKANEDNSNNEDFMNELIELLETRLLDTNNYVRAKAISIFTNYLENTKKVPLRLIQSIGSRISDKASPVRKKAIIFLISVLANYNNFKNFSSNEDEEQLSGEFKIKKPKKSGKSIQKLKHENIASLDTILHNINKKIISILPHVKSEILELLEYLKISYFYQINESSFLLSRLINNILIQNVKSQVEALIFTLRELFKKLRSNKQRCIQFLLDIKETQITRKYRFIDGIIIKSIYNEFINKTSEYLGMGNIELNNQKDNNCQENNQKDNNCYENNQKDNNCQENNYNDDSCHVNNYIDTSTKNLYEGNHIENKNLDKLIELNKLSSILSVLRIGADDIDITSLSTLITLLLYNSKDKEDLKQNIDTYKNILIFMINNKIKIDKKIIKMLIKSNFIDFSLIELTVKLIYLTDIDYIYYLLRNLKNKYKIIHVLGSIAVNHCIYLDRIKTSQNIDQINVPDEIKERRKSFNSARMSINLYDGNDVPDDDFIKNNENTDEVLKKNNNEDVEDMIFYIKEREMLYDQRSLLTQYVPLVLDGIESKDLILSKISKIALFKFMTVSSEFFNEHFDKIKTDHNSLVALGDFMFLYNPLVENLSMNFLNFDYSMFYYLGTNKILKIKGDHVLEIIKSAYQIENGVAEELNVEKLEEDKSKEDKLKENKSNGEKSKEEKSKEDEMKENIEIKINCIHNKENNPNIKYLKHGRFFIQKLLSALDENHTCFIFYECILKADDDAFRDFILEIFKPLLKDKIKQRVYRMAEKVDRKISEFLINKLIKGENPV